MVKKKKSAWYNIMALTKENNMEESFKLNTSQYAAYSTQ